MNSFIIFSLFFLFLPSCGEISMQHNNQSHNQVNTDTSFVNWNKATLLSLSNSIQSQSPVDSSVRKIYENRLSAFKFYVNFFDEKSIDTHSIRYEFLKAISENVKEKNRYCVIEANRSGEVMEIRNYFVYLKAENKADVCTYNFTNDEWVKNDMSEEIFFHFGQDLKTYLTRFGLGFNQDDVIITEFVGSKIISSEYYIYGTLIDTNNLKKILSLR